MAGLPVTSRRRGGRSILNITAAIWTAGFRWWRSSNITRTQNVSEYMLVLALGLVVFSDEVQWIPMLADRTSASTLSAT